jgi:O-Antigen ligase
VTRLLRLPLLAAAHPAGERPSFGEDIEVRFAERDWLMLILLSLWAVVFGVLVARSPKLAVAMVAGPIVLTIALKAPLTTLVMIVGLTAVVPYDFQHPLAIGGGGPGLLPSDALVLAGLLRAALVLPHKRLDARRMFAACAMLVFIALITWQCVQGLRAGHDTSVAGAEWRRLLGFGTLLIAIPILDDAVARRRLLKWLLVLAFGLGFWGVAQWFLHFSFGGDIGVRQGVSLTSSGTGQLQGGLFGFPIAVVMLVAVLTSGELRTRSLRFLVIAALALNAVDLILTFERTMWVAAAVGTLFMLARAGSHARWRAGIWAPIILTATLVVLGTVSPGTLTTAQQRLLSIGQYGTDSSVRYRLVESAHVVAKIQAKPVLGWGLGDTIFWGRPYERVPARDFNYSHNGYLWLAWKIGIPAAAILVGLMLTAAFWRGPPDAEPLFAAFRHGAQASLVTLLVISSTFPVFNTLESTCMVGLLIAVAAMPRRAAGSGRTGPNGARA